MGFQNLGHNKPGVQWTNSLTQTSIKKALLHNLIVAPLLDK